jgi:long-chain fatty acid transport protein
MKHKACLLFSATALSVVPAFSNGFYVPVQAPEATARGNAWLATADSAAAVYYNAAGLTQTESPEVIVGAYSIMLGLEAEMDSGENYEADNSWAFLPQIYAAVPINDKLVVGFGLNTPFGLATDWGSDTQFRYLATETELNYATGWVVLGYKVTDTFSIGGGFGVHYADLKIGQVTNELGPDFSTEFNGDDEALSWTLSTRWQPCEQHAFGLIYRSKTDFELDGDFEVTGVFDESAKLDFMTPSTFGGGYSYSPCKEWNFEVNIEWVNWDELNSLTLSKNTGNKSIPFNWNSNFIYSIGGTRYFENGWNVSAGYNFIENSMPDSTFTPGVADANRHWLNAGVGRKYESFKWNFAYQYAFSDNDVSGSPYGLADGTFKSRFHGLMLNCDWQF